MTDVTAKQLTLIQRLREPRPTLMMLPDKRDVLAIEAADEIERLRRTLIRARDLMRRAVTEGYSRHAFNQFLGAPENVVALEVADEISKDDSYREPFPETDAITAERFFRELATPERVRGHGMALVAEIERLRTAVVHGLVYDRTGWVCSFCHGWNDGDDSRCDHPHGQSSHETPPKS